MLFESSGIKRGLAGMMAVAGIVATACGSTSGNTGGSADTTPITVGIVMPYTGDESYYGKFADNAWEMAMAKYGSSINGHPIQLVKADSKCSPTDAVTATRDVLARKPVAIMAPACSADTLAMLPITTAAKAPLVSENLAEAVTQQGSAYVWVVNPNDGVTNKFFGSWLVQQGYSHIGIIHDTTSYGQGNSSTLASALTAAGKAPVVNASYTFSATDYSGQILSLKKANVDAAYLEGYDLQAGNLVKQAKSLGLSVPIFLPTIAADDTFAQTAGDAADGVTFVTSFIPGMSPAATQIANDTKSKYGYSANMDSVGIYEQAVAIIQGLKAAGPTATSDQLNTAIGKLSISGLPMGQLSFKSDGEINNPLVVVGTRKNGQAQQVAVLTGTL